jgi:transposase-like protein
MKPPRNPRYARHRFPAEVISHAVWLYFRFPLSLRMVEEMLVARGIEVSHETVRQWALKFGQGYANQLRRRLPAPGDKWHLDEVVISIAGQKHWLWRAVDQHGIVLDILVQICRNAKAAKRLLRKLLKKQGIAPRVMITDKRMRRKFEVGARGWLRTWHRLRQRASRIARQVMARDSGRTLPAACASCGSSQCHPGSHGHRQQTETRASASLAS